MPTVSPSALGPKPFFVDAAGNPTVSYKMFMYAAGSTSTKQNSYTNSTGSVANTNPIILNALGQTPNELWWDASLLYKVVLAPATDTDPPTNPVWTIDNLQGMNSGGGATAANEWVLYSASAIAFVNSNTFTLVGNQTLTFHIGRRLQFMTSAGFVYGRITNSVFAASTTVTMQMDGSQVLDSGLSAVYYSILTNDVLALPERIAMTSGTNTYTATVGTTRLVLGDEYKLNFAIANDGAIVPTLNLDGLGARALLLQNSAIPSAGQINGEHKIRDTAAGFIVLNPLPLTFISVRQSIQYGPLTSASPPFPALIPSTQIGNTLATGVTLKNSTAPTLYSVANGFNADGSPLNLNWVSSVDIVIPALSASSTCYIWVDTVSRTAGFVTVADTEQPGGTIPITNNKYTFDTVNMKMFLGNGAVASQSNRIIIAEVDTNGTVVTAVRNRAYQLKYDGDFTTPLPGTTTTMSKNVNFGTAFNVVAILELECLIAEGGYSVGDRVQGFTGFNGSYINPVNIAISRNSLLAVTGNVNAWIGVNLTTGSNIFLTAANWKWHFVAKVNR